MQFLQFNVILYMRGIFKIMIELNRLNGAVFYLNPHLIESMECKPDLTITMLSGNTIVVKNPPQEVVDKIILYRKKIGMESQEVL